MGPAQSRCFHPIFQGSAVGLRDRALKGSFTMKVSRMRRVHCVRARQPAPALIPDQPPVAEQHMRSSSSPALGRQSSGSCQAERVRQSSGCSRERKGGGAEPAVQSACVTHTRTDAVRRTSLACTPLR